MKLFDKQNDRLIFIENSPTEEFWSDHWLENEEYEKGVRLGAMPGMIKRYTEKFLQKPARVIDAGCGIGQNVYGLQKWGYEGYGIDFTDKVIKKTKELFPELNVLTMDVRDLHFQDNYFNGYWSLGVIEHFREGYDPIIKEAKRVIAKDGYLFVTIPWFSPLRRLKARLGIFQRYSPDIPMNNFYEYMLSDSVVVRDIEKQGFTCVLRHPYDAVKGLKDEVRFLSGPLRYIYRKQGMFFKGVRFVLTAMFAPFAGHIILLVFKKTSE